MMTLHWEDNNVQLERLMFEMRNAANSTKGVKYGFHELLRLTLVAEKQTANLDDAGREVVDPT